MKYHIFIHNIIMYLNAYNALSYVPVTGNILATVLCSVNISI
jgi:hypothetical protein